MEGNRICRQIEWYNDESKTRAWREGKTGYPWIDAIIRQLITEGLCFSQTVTYMYLDI